MKTMKRKELIETYDLVCNEIIRKFANKHGYEFSYWIGGKGSKGVGGIACFIEQYFFDMEDIIFDIRTNQPKNLIFQWQDDCVENQNRKHIINFTSYSMGLRFKDLKDEKE